MRIDNRHERRIPASLEVVGRALDTLSGPADELWPVADWPPMRFDRHLQEGARGGHGPVRYHVSEYVPGRRVVFQFGREGLVGGLDGRHYFEVVPRRGATLIRHVVDADCRLATWAKWRVIVEPLHDARIEDAFDQVEARLGGRRFRQSRWTLRVRLLRRGHRRGTGRSTARGR